MKQPDSLFGKIFRVEDMELIQSVSSMNEPSINLGLRTDYEPTMIIQFMDCWCNRIDTLSEIDKRLYGSYTWRSKQAFTYRGFTYEEYSALFNQHVLQEDYVFYPVFTQLNRGKGGVYSEKKRQDFIFKYELNEEDYVRILLENGYECVLSFFLTQRAKLSAMLPYKDLLAHTYIGAPTGWGKSVLMRTLFYHLVKKYQKHSHVLIDPHGNLAESVIRLNIFKDSDRLIYIDPFLNPEKTPTFNPFHSEDKSLQNIVHVVEQNILALEEILSRVGGDLSEAMTSMLEKCLYFLLQRPDSNIDDLRRLLAAEEVILEEARMYDSFFNTPYEKHTNKTRDGLAFRLSRLMNSPVLKHLLTGESTFNLEAAINSNKVVVFNLSKLGEMSQQTIGKLLIASLKSMVRKRKKEGPKHTFLMVDEAQNFTTGSVEYMLSQLRGFGLHSILATQYIEQFGDQAKSVSQNVAIKVLAHEKPQELKKIIDVPKDMELRRFEFLLKVRHRTLYKFKSPSLLIDHPKRYELTEEELDELKNKQSKKYYKPLHSTAKRFIPSRKPEDNLVEQQEQKRNNTAPPFELFLPENLDDD